MIPIDALKQKMASQLAKAAGKLTSSQKLIVAANVDISTKTLERYTSGFAEEVRRMELAERILKEMKDITANQPTNA